MSDTKRPGTFQWVEETRKRSVLYSAQGEECGEVERMDIMWHACAITTVGNGVDCFLLGNFGSEQAARQAVIGWWIETVEQARGLGLCGTIDGNPVETRKAVAL